MSFMGREACSDMYANQTEALSLADRAWKFVEVTGLSALYEVQIEPAIVFGNTKTGGKTGPRLSERGPVVCGTKGLRKFLFGNHNTFKRMSVSEYDKP